MESLSPVELAGRTDCAVWAPATTTTELETMCTAAARFHFRALCVNGSRVELAYSRLEDSGVKVVGLVGFPLGAMDSDAKRYETDVAIDQGAHEIEVVLNIGRLKDNDPRYVLRELRDVAEAADERPVCVCLETTLLTREELILACHLVLDSGAHSVSTGTGFWPNSRAQADEVKVLREALGPKFGLKATVGSVDAATASLLLQAGATRFGTIGTPGGVAPALQ